MYKSPMTEKQWRWIADRWMEGYTLVELGDFLGMHRETVRRGLIRLGIRPAAKEDLIPLTEREKEYKELEEK